MPPPPRILSSSLLSLLALACNNPTLEPDQDQARLHPTILGGDANISVTGPADTVYPYPGGFSIDWVVTNHEDTAVVAATSAGGTGAFTDWKSNGTGDSSFPNPVSLDGFEIAMFYPSESGSLYSNATNGRGMLLIRSGATDTVTGYYKCTSPQAADIGRVYMSVGQGQASVAVRTVCDLNWPSSP